MHIKEILEKNNHSFSFEFFPPKTEKSAANLYKTISELMPLKPSFVSITYGAGGSTRELTHDLVIKLHKETDITIIPHLTCVGSTKEEIYRIIKQYHDHGIRNVMALRGDPPIGQQSFVPVDGGFNYATELVAFIKENFPDFGIGVAGFVHGHHETPNRLLEIDYLKKKVDQGADYICTQLFFDNHDFYDFQDRCELAGINVPIIAGVMPIISVKNMQRMAELASGTRFPAALLKSINRAENDGYVEKVGIHWATEQVRDLLHKGAKGVHFYTLNKSKATLNIYETLGVSSSDMLY